MPLICFASPNGGVGRTTLAANVARELTRMGARVIALDADPQNALGMHFGLDLRDGFGFLATLRYAADARAAWRAAMRSSPSGVSFLPFGQLGMDGANAVNAALLERPEMLSSAVADMLSVSGVTVVADFPAGPSASLAALLRLTDLLVVPLLPTASSVAQVPAIEGGRFAGVGAGAAAYLPAEKLRFVINQWGMPGKLAGPIAQGASQQLAGRLLGAVRHDEAVPEACAAQRLLGDFAPASAAAADMAGLTGAIVAQIEAQHVSRSGDAHSSSATNAAANTRSQQLRNAHGLISLAEIHHKPRETVAQKAHR